MMIPDHKALTDLVLDYLDAHPQAMDTQDGIARWWLERKKAPVEREVLSQVLERLVQEGHLEVTHASGSRLYRLEAVPEVACDRRDLGQLAETLKDGLPERGMLVLFAGLSRTGKAMAAEVLGDHLHRELYRVNLSEIVGKYIGETEKNLARVFDEARHADVALFLDEADALFGKRTEVKDAHDRYASSEVAYLLQRVEEFNGVVVLATNDADAAKAIARKVHRVKRVVVR
jgi:hypothetical protein